MTFFRPQSWICTTGANAKFHIVRHFYGMRASEMLGFKKLLSQIRTPRLRPADVLLQNGSSVVFGRNDGEGDLQLVFNFYCAAACFYGGNAVIGLQDGEFALAMKFVAICGDTQGESNWLFNSVKIQFACESQFPAVGNFL